MAGRLGVSRIAARGDVAPSDSRTSTHTTTSGRAGLRPSGADVASGPSQAVSGHRLGPHRHASGASSSNDGSTSSSQRALLPSIPAHRVSSNAAPASARAAAATGTDLTRGGRRDKNGACPKTHPPSTPSFSPSGSARRSSPRPLSPTRLWGPRRRRPVREVRQRPRHRRLSVLQEAARRSHRRTPTKTDGDGQQRRQLQARVSTSCACLAVAQSTVVRCGGRHQHLGSRLPHTRKYQSLSADKRIRCALPPGPPTRRRLLPLPFALVRCACHPAAQLLNPTLRRPFNSSQSAAPHRASSGLGNASAARLRRELADWVEEHPDELIADTPVRDWVKWDTDGSSVRSYARRMAVGGWGGGIEMAACARLKRVNVHGEPPPAVRRTPVISRCRHGHSPCDPFRRVSSTVYEHIPGQSGYKRISCFDAPGASSSSAPTVHVLYRAHHLLHAGPHTPQVLLVPPDG